MAVHKVRKGLSLPIAGAPEQVIEDAPAVNRVAIMARDYVGMKPKMLVEEGAQVRLGEPLFEDRKNPGVLFVAPGAGTIKGIYRGEKRALQSVVISLSGDDTQEFSSFNPSAKDSRESAQALLVESGLWTALRTRPMGKVPAVGSTPEAIFVTAIDSHPLAPKPEVVLQGREEDFERGLTVLAKLTDGPVYLCRAPGSGIEAGSSGARVEEFAGKHPAGTVGYHIHVLHPVTRGRMVWHIGYQDVARVGHLFATGQLDTTHVAALAGPMVKKPRLLRTRMGAAVAPLTAGELKEGDARTISGSVLHGDRASGEIFGYLGRYHNQVSVVAEGYDRSFLGWLGAGFDKFSVIPTFLSSLIPNKTYALNTNTNGSRRAMIPIGMYERVMPMDLMITHLLRAITVEDTEWAEELGVYELDEEDLALCTFVCPGKMDFGSALRRTLTTIDKEG